MNCFQWSCVGRLVGVSLTWQRQSEDNDCRTDSVDEADLFNRQADVVHLKREVWENYAKSWNVSISVASAMNVVL